jgi:hypothetical protein
MCQMLVISIEGYQYLINLLKYVNNSIPKFWGKKTCGGQSIKDIAPPFYFLIIQALFN